MTSYFVALLLMTLLGSVASLFLKKASGSSDFMAMVKNPNLYLGGFLYLASAIINIYVLRYLDYSVVFPLTSLTYVWTMFISKFELHEKITNKKMIGIGLILLGSIFVSK